MQGVIVKKVILLCALLVSSFILSSCSPIVQGAAAVTTVATMSNDRRSAGEILDDKNTLDYEALVALSEKIQYLKICILTSWSITKLY